jgi:hypothetical protein
MLNTTFGLKTAVCLTASVLLGAATYGAIIYDNTSSFPRAVTAEGNGVEHGDVVIFAGTDRLLTSFQFEYFLGPNAGGAVEGNEMAQIFLRALDGAAVGDGNTLPGTLLWSSGTFNIESGYHTINVDALNLQVGDSIAWTVSFTGIEADENAGLLFDVADNPVGTNPRFTDPVTGQLEHYTIRHEADGSWSLLNHTTPNVADNLNARFTAIPEPGTWAILLGGLATLGLVRRRKS